MTGTSTFSPRRVLILDFDLFWSRIIGGGQTTYKSVIEQNPGTTFYYFAINETENPARPANAIPIPFREAYGPSRNAPPSDLAYVYNHLVNGWNIARSLADANAPTHYDVIDMPDFNECGLFIHDILAEHGISINKTAVSLHGKVEVTLREQWPYPDRLFRHAASARCASHLQIRAADVGYTLSKRYARYWSAQKIFHVNIVDPLAIAGPLAPARAPKTADAPDVVFIGRLERCKGPDLFVDLAWCLRAGSVRRIVLCGSENRSPADVSSTEILNGAAVRRRLSVDLAGNQPQSALRELCSGRTVVVQTSRYDSFNLAALEALRLGCPTFVSRDAGISEWIEETLPALSDLIIDLDSSRTAATNVRAAIANYDGLRDRVVETIQSHMSPPDYDSLRKIYDGPSGTDQRAREIIATMLSRLNQNHRPIEGARADNKIETAPATVTASIHHAAPSITSNGRFKRRRQAALIRASGLFDEDYYRNSNADIAGAGIDPLTHFVEYGADEGRFPNPLFDSAWYLDGNADVKAAGHNPLVHYVLHGQHENRDPHPEFNTSKARAIFQTTQTSDESPLAWFLRCLKQPHPISEVKASIVIDRRRTKAPLASVFIAASGAKAALAPLFANLAIQSLAAEGGVEIILLDDSRATARPLVDRLDPSIPVLYALVDDPGLCPRFLNAALALARAPFVTILEANEVLHPDALAILSAALRSNSNADWAVADAMTSIVDRNGRLITDGPFLDRSGASSTPPPLTALALAGGLYRRSLHETAGSFDERLSALAPLAFRCKAASRITALHIPKVLAAINVEQTQDRPRWHRSADLIAHRT